MLSLVVDLKRASTVGKSGKASGRLSRNLATPRHRGQALMSWAVANARVEPKGNAIIIAKQASGSAKTYPLMAAFNAVALMSTNPWSSRPGIFLI
jgi:phage terminase large subunit-like protein